VVYEHYLKDHFCPEEVEYYLCGPPMMSSAVLAMLEDLGVDRESVLFDDFGSHVPGEQP
jgi:Na+-transporting NADH:ubiquinone oxidoreductase subunit F